MTSLIESLKTDIEFDEFITAAGDLATISGKNNLQKSLLRRLVTTPGSFVFMPNFGVGIKRFLNGPMTIDQKRDLANLIVEQFEDDIRVKKVTAVKVTQSIDEPAMITIVTKIIVVGADEEDFIFEPVGEES